MKYYDLKKYWPKVKRHLGDEELNNILVRDFNKYTYGRWGEKFTHGQFPTDFESCDWQLNHRGRRPAFWKYTKHAACHWLVNFSLRLAMLTEPNSVWRIISSSKHSTVWDGNETLFDLTFQAMGVSPDECFSKAFKRQLKPGKHLQVYFAQHYTSDDFPRSISRQQLFVLHVAANYKLCGDSTGWWADRDGVSPVHSPATVKSLLKKGLLQGNARGENIALGSWDGKSPMEPPIPTLWTSAKGRKLLDKIRRETGIVFDPKNFGLLEPGTHDQPASEQQPSCTIVRPY